MYINIIANRNVFFYENVACFLYITVARSEDNPGK